ncbi:MAG: hypothetical protein ABWZ77_01335 [Naasia sp.]
MTDRNGTGGIDEETIRRLIKKVDPARSLAPASDADITRLTEDAMTDTSNTTTPSTTDRRPARRRAGLFGALGAVAAVAATAVILPLAAGSSSAITELEQPAASGPAAACAPVSADYVAQAQSAFSARVTSIEDGTVTLSVQDRFTGEVEDTVEVAQGTNSGVDGEAITFEADTTYLISTNGEMILTCGTSGVDSAELRAIYDAAFPGS